MTDFVVEMVLGELELVPTREIRGSRIYMGGYAIHRDRHGNEIKRTPNQWNGYVECWSEREAKRISDSATNGTSAQE